jgi:hypothetical protein
MLSLMTQKQIHVRCPAMPVRFHATNTAFLVSQTTAPPKASSDRPLRTLGLFG